MRVQNKSKRVWINKKKPLLSLFSFFFLFLLFFFLVSPAKGVYGTENISVIHEDPSVVLINGEYIYVKSGDTYSFYQGYQFHLKGANSEGSRIWLELSLNGKVLKDIIATKGTQFSYSRGSAEILNLTVDSIYSGTDSVLVRFSPVYQYLDPTLPMPTETDKIKPEIRVNSSEPPKSSPHADGFNARIFLLGFGAMLLVFGFFAKKR